MELWILLDFQNVQGVNLIFKVIAIHSIFRFLSCFNFPILRPIMINLYSNVRVDKAFNLMHILCKHCDPL